MPTKRLLLFPTIFLASFFVGFFAVEWGGASLFVFENIKTDQSHSQKISLEEDLAKGLAIPLECDVLVGGGGSGGIAAALQSSRLGVNTCLVEESNWLGGMLTSAGVSAIDGRGDAISGIFKEFLTRVEAVYAEAGELEETKKCTVSFFCFEPNVGRAVLEDMVAEEEQLTVYKNAKIDRVYRDGNLITGVRFKQNGQLFIVKTKVLVDATEFGDLMFLGDVPYDLGPDLGSNELHGNEAEACTQPLTYVAILENYGGDNTIPVPKNYSKDNYVCSVDHPGCRGSKSQFSMERLLEYGALPNGKLMINIPSHSYGNDFHATSDDLDKLNREEILELAKQYTLGFVYFMQTELSMEEYGLSDEFGTEDKLAIIPYVRESRRLEGEIRLLEDEILPDERGRAQFRNDAVAVGEYPIDLHFCTPGKGDVYHEIPPYSIPLGVAIPEDVDGFMVTEKNISVSHIVNGTTRLQPVVMSMGQAVGVTSALAVLQGVQPDEVAIEDVQEELISAHSRIVYFSDLPTDHYATERITRLALHNLISGYPDLSFGTNNPVNFGELESLYKSVLRYYNKVDNYSLDAQNYFAENDTEASVSRGELATFINQYVLEGDSERGPFFKDVGPSNPHSGDINALAKLHIVNSQSGQFRPYDLGTRAETVMMLMSAAELLEIQ